MSNNLFTVYYPEELSTIASCGNLLTTADVDNKRIYVYNVAGVTVKVDKEFVNKTKETFLHITGSNDVFSTKLDINVTILVDTEVYDKFDYHVEKGLLYVELFEKINKAPKFDRVPKPKKEKKTTEEKTEETKTEEQENK